MMRLDSISSSKMSVASYFITGINTNYYNGLLLLSFIQFTIMPTQIKFLTYTDILLILIYFPLNYFPFDIDFAVLLQQVASFSTYAVVKYIAAKRGYGLIFESFSDYSNEREVDQHRNMSELFMELCYLISNPLFISQSYLSKALKSRNQMEKDEYIEKSLNYHFRMNNIVKRMQEFNQKKMKLEDYKEYFSVDDEALALKDRD